MCQAESSFFKGVTGFKRVVTPALLAATAAFCLLALPAAAQSYTVLNSFVPQQPDPQGLIQASDGDFYGTTNQGGTNGLGSVFKVTPAGALTTLYSFSSIDGAGPSAGLVQGTDGNFYGTTTHGGPNGSGTVFKITPGGALTTLYFFSGSDGANPYAGLTQGTDGNFYGSTYRFGPGGSGTIFRITPAGMLTTLHSFWGIDEGNPVAALVQGTDGSFYGTTSRGGPSSGGTVFRITPAGTLTTLHSFSFANSDGANPSGALVQGTDGNLYGTTSVGGGGVDGTVFRITPAGALTTLHEFSGIDGAYPEAGLALGADGNFYGTTYQGGTSDAGTVFKITPAGTLTTLYSFTGSNGSYPQATLVQGTDGNFYGTTDQGGPSGDGTVFNITPAGALTTLYSWVGSDGANPLASLVQGTDGNFYGTTTHGGVSGFGTVFKITPAGTLTTLHSFAGSDGADPQANLLVQGTDGNLYGTTTFGGVSGFGTVFRITPAGTLTTLHSFSGSDGANPYAGLVQRVDGNFYGTTGSGGASGNGTVFRITPVGVLVTLHSFRSDEGTNPRCHLAQGADGNFYGTTYQGGPSGDGTVFKITLDGALTTLYSFSGIDGQYPLGGLALGTDGTFYGATSEGGPFGFGTVFRITPEGTLTTLHLFGGIAGGGLWPSSDLVQGTDGNLYGTTFQGGDWALPGTIFKITPAGSLTTLHSFSGSDGQQPSAALVQGTDGNFYGTASDGGPRGGGVVFRLTPGPGPSPTVTGVSPSSGPVAGGTLVTISGTDFQPGATVTFGGSPATAATYLSATTTYALTPSHIAGAVTVTVTNPDAQAGSLPSAYTYTCSWTPSALNGGPVCAGSTISLSTPTVSGATYSWTGPNGFTSTVQNPTIPNATAANTGTYSVTVTVSGCASDPANTTVVVNPTPSAPAIAAPAAALPGQTGLMASVLLNAGSAYGWDITNGTITGGAGTNQITFTAGAASAAVVLTVLETNASGCASPTATASVTVSPQPVGLAEDAHATAGTISNVNGVLEPGETVLVNASWKNNGVSPLALTGTASTLTGPAGATYSLLDSSAGYGTIAPGATADSFSAGGPSYRLSVSNPVTRPAAHWDATFLETLSDGATKTWTLHVGSSFTDVPISDGAYAFVENIFHNGITAGCGGGNYCPASDVSRWQAAVFLATAMIGPSGTVPASGTIPSVGAYDCAVGGLSLFGDVLPTDPGCRFIHYVYAQGLTAGCGGGNYCPESNVTRWQMAVFLATGMVGPSGTVPTSGTVPSVGSYNCAAGGNSLFGDVQPTDPGCRFIHFIYANGVTAGCGGGNYCPTSFVTRWQMAPFLVTAFKIPFLH